MILMYQKVAPKAETMFTEKSSFSNDSLGVIIPSYNYGHFLLEAFQSVLRQTRRPDKILIVDDGSSDVTEEVGEHLAATYPDLVHFHRSSINRGIVKTFNTAMDLMDTDYVCFVGADNRIGSRYLEEGYASLRGGFDVAYSDFVLFGSRASIVNDQFPEKWKKGQRSPGVFNIEFPEFSDETKKTLLGGQNFINGSSMFRRSMFKKVGGYIEKADEPEDYGLFVRMIHAGAKPKKMKTAHLEYRQHSSDQANIRLGAYNLMLFYKNKFEKQKEAERELVGGLEGLKTENLRMKNQLDQIYNVIGPASLLRIWAARKKKQIKKKLGKS